MNDLKSLFIKNNENRINEKNKNSIQNQINTKPNYFKNSVHLKTN